MYKLTSYVSSYLLTAQGHNKFNHKFDNSICGMCFSSCNQSDFDDHSLEETMLAYIFLLATSKFGRHALCAAKVYAVRLC